MKQIVLKPETRKVIYFEEELSSQLNSEDPNKKYLAFSFEYNPSENEKPFMFYSPAELIKRNLLKVLKDEKFVDFFIQKISQKQIHDIIVNEQEKKITIILIFVKIITFGNIIDIKNLIKKYEQIAQIIDFNQDLKNRYKYEHLFKKAIIVQKPFSLQRLIEIALTMQQPVFKIQDGLIEVVNAKFYHNPGIKYIFESNKYDMEDLIEKIQNKFAYVLSERILAQKKLILQNFS